MKGFSMVVMDLDGTFIYGDYQDKIIRFCIEHELIYGFVTNRSYKACLYPIDILHIYRPFFLATEAGTELYLKSSAENYYKDYEYEKLLLLDWPGTESIVDILKDLKECELQENTGGVRISCFTRIPAIVNTVKDRLKSLKLQVDNSNKQYVDILPVNGGIENCVKYLSSLFHAPLSSIITSGDKEHDYDILKKPQNGIVVSNCYNSLFQRIKDNKDIFFSQYAGSRGVYEGLNYFFSALA